MSIRLPVAIATLALVAFGALWLVRGPTLPPDGPPANPITASGTWRPDAATLREDLVERARELARVQYASRAETVPSELTSLDFDAYRSIRFRPEAAFWRGRGPFEVQLFHLGSIHTEPVRIHFVEADSIRTQTYDPALFTFEGAAAELGELPPGGVPGFAGFRVHYPLNRPDVQDELAAFLGASYFRVLGTGHEYGLSARGLAVDPAVDGPEEFPAFREYWIERPDADGGGDALTIHALLEGPSVVGAYRFELTPGTTTTLGVDAHLFARRDIRKLGVAPMSSMFLHAPGHGPAHDDFRPRVHDSDGLQMLTGRGEWIWRPLGNGPGLHVTMLRDEEPAGFGLFQRSRAFEDFLDLEARYHLRPSYWIEILEGDWGGGGVELMEIPTPSEFSDNIATYWVPDQPFREGEERRFVYRLETLGVTHPDMDVAHVARTAIGWDALPGQTDPPPRSRRRFVVDFVGGDLPNIPLEQELRADLSLLRGDVEGVMVQTLPGNKGRRVTFTIVPDGDHPADMRLLLVDQGKPVSETWSYVWYSSRIP
ncbi:MAG: glucan biosynthesis protein G [Gemmatimonadota bacterium]